MKIMGLMEQTNGGVDLGFVLFCVGVIVAVGLLGFVPIRMARVRESRWVEGIVAGVIFWGCLMGGSAIYSKMEQQQYAKEQAIQIASGYFDPSVVNQPPGWPWGVWVGLMMGYGGLMAGAMGTKAKDKS